ncbi:MAG: peptidoglycan-binding protein [Candidatus Paceibacterota bacterium]
MSTFKTFSELALVVVVAMLIGVPVVGQAQQGNSGQIEQLRNQITQIQQQIKELRQNKETDEEENATSSDQEGAGNRPGAAGPPSFGDRLPEQASDRAKQVMQCLELGRTLRAGDAGTTVEQVQKSLKEQGFFEYPEATGYFGPITEEAVQKFQQAKGIVDSGSPETTGFGQIGPRTRAALAQATCLRETASSENNDDDSDDTATSTNDEEDNEKEDVEDASTTSSNNNDDEDEATNEDNDDADEEDQEEDISDSEIEDAIAQEIRDNQTGFNLDPDQPEMDYDLNEDGKVNIVDVGLITDFDSLSEEDQDSVREILLDAVRERFTGFDELSDEHNLDVNSDQKIDTVDVSLIRDAFTF